MPYKVTKAPGPERVWLKDLDVKEGDPEPKEKDRTYISVKHADGNTRFLLEQISTGNEWVYDAEINGQTRRVTEREPSSTYMRQARLAWSLIDSCNILDEESKPLLGDNMTWAEFLRAWAILDDVHATIMKAIYEVNPQYGNPQSGNGN